MGHSIELWLGQLDNFKQAILDRLAQSAYPIEEEYFDDFGHPERVQYIMKCDPELWQVFGFLDDTNVRLVQVKEVDDLAGIWHMRYKEHFIGEFFYIISY